MIAVAPRGQTRATVTVAHARLSAPEDVAFWKAYWAHWLRELDED